MVFFALSLAIVVSTQVWVSKNLCQNGANLYENGLILGSTKSKKECQSNRNYHQYRDLSPKIMYWATGV